MTYRPRGMPARFMADAPEIVRRNVVDIIAVKPAAPLEYDVIFRQDAEPRGGTSYGLDFGNGGEQGCHFYLSDYDMRAYRERTRRKRTRWADLPKPTQTAILRYLAE